MVDSDVISDPRVDRQNQFLSEVRLGMCNPWRLYKLVNWEKLESRPLVSSYTCAFANATIQYSMTSEDLQTQPKIAAAA